jgi:class 3 adenylate cyclase/tetratricopeptide (TPR) repeat protein
VSTTRTMACGTCGEQTPAGSRFCIHCGSPAPDVCPSCGHPAVPGGRFCADCGAPLGVALAGAGVSQAPTATLVSERRLVSVLFADLVGFTTLAEHRDPEEVRELLSQYFERCRTLIERYGGTVEKFIGDAVMAVWGTPVAREDDAERSVRAALALTSAVSTLGEEVGMPELRVRAGVLTGSAAVEVGAESEGMVLGDTVNTASRLQSIAAAGTVLVDDVTRRASEAAIAYEDAGTHQVKGREQPVRAWTALRVVAGAGGARRSAGLEAPFVGRDHELQAIIEASESSAVERRAQLVAVVGEAGSGKSRLLWEYFKYLDGIEESRYWHQGRCLSYGEGVAYWALAEMIRSRAGIAEEESPATAREKLHEAVERFVTDDRERRLVEPRLAHLLRLDPRPDADRADLFSGWRLFFERMAQTDPVILAFEDLQWADSGLLDFIDYLLEWSSDYPIFVLALGRPEFRQRRTAWDLLSLEPLTRASIGLILDGLVPGLPDELIDLIARRSEGIPLYAVETTRMLQDRGLLVQEGAKYVVTGEVSDLEVPETLQALVAARLDGLSSDARTLLQDAAVLGHSFSAAAVAALSGRPEREVEAVLDGLVGAQVLARDDDPRSPERGLYVFLQALLRTVAYGTLSRRARKSRHLAAAQQLRGTWPGEAREIAEVLASHYLEAIRADPEAEDVAALRASARETLTAAGQAAASLALGPEAQRYLEQAAELADNDRQRAELYEQSGRALRQGGNTQAAQERLRTAIELYERDGSSAGGSAAVALASLIRYEGRFEEARALLDRFRAADIGIDRVTRAEGLAELASTQVLAGVMDDGGSLIEEALLILEDEQAWPALSSALITRAVYLVLSHRPEEGYAVLHHALAMAERHDLPQVALRARFNLAGIWIEHSRLGEALEELREGLLLARERGDRMWELQLYGQQVAPLVVLGRWDDAAALADALLAGDVTTDSLSGAAFLAPLAAARGEEELLARCVAMAERPREDALDQRAAASVVFGLVALHRGEYDEAQRLVEAQTKSQSSTAELVEQAYALSVEAAIAAGDEATMIARRAAMDELRPARATPLLRASRARLAAELAHLAGEHEAVAKFEDEAESLLRQVEARPRLASALLERARRGERPEALAEGRAILVSLGAVRWLERVDHQFHVVA